jgi:hypothetical protein
VATKLPLVMYGGRLAELQAGDEVASGSSKLLQWAYAISDLEASGTTQMPWQSQPPSTSQGTQYSPLNLTFAPASASSILEVRYEVCLSPTTAANMVIALFDSEVGANAVDAFSGYVNANQVMRLCSTAFLPSASTLSRQFTVRYGTTTASVTSYVNRSAMSMYANLFGAALRSMISVKEYAP